MHQTDFSHLPACIAFAKNLCRFGFPVYVVKPQHGDRYKITLNPSDDEVVWDSESA